MIVLLATLGAPWLRGRLVVQARDRVAGEEEAHEHQHGSPGAGPPPPGRTRCPHAGRMVR